MEKHYRNKILIIIIKNKTLPSVNSTGYRHSISVSIDNRQMCGSCSETVVKRGAIVGDVVRSIIRDQGAYMVSIVT